MTRPKPALHVVPRDAHLANRTDDELMQLAAAGVAEAFAEIVGRYQRVVRATCGRALGAAGDDLAQDVFVQIWQSRASYAPSGQFRAYLFTVLRNRVRNARRAQKRPSPPLDLENNQASQLDELLVQQRRQRVWRCVAKLPDAQREAIILRFTGDLEHAEIAKVVGRSEATVRSRVFLGLARLRRLLGKGEQR